MGKSKDLATGASTLYQTQTTSDTRYVNTAGDTMTGNLGVNGYIDLNTSGNRAKLGYDSNNVYIGSTSGTGALYFKNNITSSDAPHSSGTNRMIIDGSGIVTTPNQPSMSGRSIRPVDTAGYADTGLSLYFADMTHNTGNHWNNSTGVWTCPVAGKYFCYAAFLIDNDHTAGTLARFAFRRNGTEFFVSYNHDKYSTSYGGTATCGGIFDCAANDTITCQATHGLFHTGAESSFTICLLH